MSESGTEQFRERPENCPLCGEQQSGLDFHHWVYDPEEIGCYLCRECHETIHDGKAMRTKTTPWLPYCVDNLVRVHLKKRPDENQVQTICERYNLPTTEEYEFDFLVRTSLIDLGERNPRHVDTETEHEGGDR